MSSYIEQTIAGLANRDYTHPDPGLINLSNLSRAEEKLLEQTWTGVDVQRRRQIMSQLVELAEDNVELNFDGIFRYALSDSDAEVRAKAIEGLWECEDVSLISLLIERLERDTAVAVQLAAATALGNFALLAEFNKIRSRHASLLAQALLRVAADPTRLIAVRARALESVSPLSRPEVRDAIELAYRSDNLELKASAIHAMGHNCDTSWLPILVGEMGNANADIRCEAADASGELGEKEATPYLVKLIDDTDARVALSAIQALGKVGGTEAKKRLKELLAEPEETVRQAARDALDELEAEEDPFRLKMQKP